MAARRPSWIGSRKFRPQKFEMYPGQNRVRGNTLVCPVFFTLNWFTQKVREIAQKFRVERLWDDRAVRYSLPASDCPFSLIPLATVLYRCLFWSSGDFCNWRFSTYFHCGPRKGMFLAVNIFWNPWYFSVWKIYWLPLKSQNKRISNLLQLRGNNGKYFIKCI